MIRRRAAKPNRLIARYQRAHPTTQRAVIAVPIVLAFSGATGISLVGTALCAAVLVGLMHESKPASYEPSPEQLERIDRERAQDEEDEYLASGAGERVHEEALSALQALLGQDVIVTIGTAARPSALLEGTLLAAQDSAFSGDEEVLLFLVGAGAAFYVDRRQLTAPRAQVQRYNGVVELVSADGTTIAVQTMHARAEHA